MEGLAPSLSSQAEPECGEWNVFCADGFYVCWRSPQMLAAVKLFGEAVGMAECPAAGPAGLRGRPLPSGRRWRVSGRCL